MPYGYAPAQRTNGFAIAALICGLAGFVTGCTAPLAVIFGLIARSQIRTSREEGAGFALAGIILGAVVIAIFVVLIVVIAAVSNTSGPTY
jgi:hypothetical protein